MIIREEYLVKLNSRGKIQCQLLQLDYHPLMTKYSIYRHTSQFGGKVIEAPIKEITQGKVKRTIEEQANLEYNAALKYYLDSGYIRLSLFTQKKYTDVTENELLAYLGGSFKTDQKGIPKPMLAKSVDQCVSDILEKDWYCSKKLDGVRCLMYYKDGMVLSASRGGGDYNVATRHLREDPMLVKLFQDNPTLILDGELYIHDVNYPLQKISGLARLQERTEECDKLEYWVYDYVSDKPFKERYKVLMELQKLFEDNPKIKFIDHVLLAGYYKIKPEHDRYVREGFEGLCARNPEKGYGIGKRSSIYLVKMKERKDDEFEIVGIRTGLRDEDMCFVLKTKEGKKFAAKPMGDAQTRVEYLKHKDEYIGKRATCTYFAISNDGIPTQPVMTHIRPDDE